MTSDPHPPFRSALTHALGAAQTLPVPDADARAHSEALCRLIRGEITAAGGRIGFAHFMQLALYAPGLGYYSAGLHKFGTAGDFVTAPELGALFARCLAQQCLPLLRGLGEEADLLEVGAGSGALAADLLLALESHGQLPRYYYILELSADLRERQARQLKERAPHLAARVRWLDSLPQPPLRGIVLANELLDAMPVERFRVEADGLQQLCVAYEGDEFIECTVPAEAALAERIQSRLDTPSLPPGYTSEINLHAEAWLRSMAGALAVGAILLIDYGYPRAEYYHAGRSEGTLLCHYRHRAHNDPLRLVGLQDITSHVEFTALAEAGTEVGLTLLGYTTQAAFLLANGITQLAQQSAGDDVRAQIALSQEIKKLTLPQEMGELFKVMGFGRGIETPLAGFGLQDRRGRL